MAKNTLVYFSLVYFKNWAVYYIPQNQYPILDKNIHLVHCKQQKFIHLLLNKGSFEMAFDVKIQLNKKFSVTADIDTVYNLLSDVPASTSHFPDLENLIEEAANTYRWEMKKIGLGPIQLQTIYACEYMSDPVTKSIVWEPRDTANNSAKVSGKWILTATSSGCDLNLFTDAVITIPLPSLAGIGLKPVVKVEFETLTNTYIKNLAKTFSTVGVTA
jgi:carbon monoxide dehydrogenase subunit G